MSCPYCNSPVLLNDLAGNQWYKCGTVKTFRSASCVDREPLATELRNAQAHIKRLEDCIHRAAVAFFRDGSDGQVASGMLAILEEERGKP